MKRKTSTNILPAARKFQKKLDLLQRKIKKMKGRTRSPRVAGLIEAGAAAAYLVETGLDAAITLVDKYWNVPPEKN